VRYDIVALTALAAAVLAGLVKPEDAFAGQGAPPSSPSPPSWY
jgi:hypothetical protein